MIFAFDDYELDEACFELRRGGRVVELQPKVLELLLHLVRNRDRVVPKREILETVWPDSAVTDGSLARAVSLARLALGDRSVDPAMIVTVPRRGYRFQASVRVTSSRPPVDGAAAAAEDDPTRRYVGRASLLARLEAGLDGALGGRGRILFLSGEAGIGKTRTAEILLERARRAGARVATAWGAEDGAPPYETWARILRALAEGAPEALASLSPGQRSDLARLAPELGIEAAPPAPTHGGDGARFRLFEAVQAFLARCAALRPLALFFDDLHGADSESIWLLESVGQTIGRHPIAILATCRREDADLPVRHARALERLLHATSLEHWPLEGLRREELREFVCVRLGGAPDPALVGVLEHKTGGNPFLLGESLRSLEARGLLGERREASAWEALLPAGIQPLLRPKLRWLSLAATAALAGAAAVAVDLDRGLLERCLEGASDLDASLRELAASGLLLRHGSRLRFPHALVREALYAELVPPGDARRALHARIAKALEQQAGASDESLGERAHHACEAVPLFDPVRAAALARAAAEQAAHLHDFDRAATWYRRALDGLEQAGVADARALRAELWLGLGAAQTRAVGLEQARVSFRAAAHHARSARRNDLLAAAALGFAHRPSGTGYGEPEVIELLEEALGAVPAGHPALRIRLQSRLAGELRYAERSRAEALVDGAVEAARGLGDRSVLAQALDDCSFVRWSPADPEGWIELNTEIVRAAQAANDLELLLLGRKGRVTGFLEVGDLAAVDRELRVCEQTAEALRTPYARWLCAALRAMRALLDGELDDAERRVADAILLGERVESSEVALELQAQLVYLRSEQGRVGEIEPAARSQVQRFPDAPAWRACLARILTAMGRTREARHELERLGRSRFADVPRDRGWLPTLALAAEVAQATGDARSAELLEPLLAPYARLGVVAGSGFLYYGAVAHHLGLLAAVRSQWTAAISHFEAALGIEQRAGARVWEARTRLAYARALLCGDPRGERPRAARLVAEALETARSHGLVDLASDARELEATLWTGRGGSSGRADGMRGSGRVRDSEG